ncbi:DUF3850 domain-containing protein [Patescibacteria group bacterium]|nr:MAG: DUF3850 domain-containing protein [Patescibacteria group bacterium]
MAVVRKKILPKFFEAVLSGKKNYELRLNDFDISEGDTLILEEINEKTRERTGRTIEKVVTRVGRFKIDELFWPREEILEKGLQIISFN